MKTIYEGMLILPKGLDEEAVDAVIGRVHEEIRKQGGTVGSTTRLGRRNFARPLKGQDAGQYVVMQFELEGGNMALLRERLKLQEGLLRFQFTRPGPVAPAAPPAAPEAE
ncbi:MAG: 30S ribosomal protein S6 [Candidatus Marinimicrobia bacterium]|nr:30S ribosomal protein S6 [Candidatus Neomarinimicrobiota bacterium]